MKKILVVCAALLLSFSLVLAQEADDTGAGVGLSVIPRLDLSPEFYNDGSGSQFTLGNSSIYTLFEGNISENLSFSVANHWAGFYDVSGDVLADTKDLYANTLKRDANWLDWAYLAWNTGNWTFTFGKDAITTGGWEFDDYDYDVYPVLSSNLWNNFSTYHWGLKAGYSPVEDNEITLQVTTAPGVDGLFEAPLFSYSLGWLGNVGGVETKWSWTALDGFMGNQGTFWNILSLGQKYQAGDFLLTLDLFSQMYPSDYNIPARITAMPSVLWSLSDSLEFFLKGGIEKFGDDTDFFGGAAVQWYPLENLRLHAVAGYNTEWECASLTLGAIWYINIL